MALPSSLFLGMILSNHKSSNKCNIVQYVLCPHIRLDIMSYIMEQPFNSNWGRQGSRSRSGMFVSLNLED